MKNRYLFKAKRIKDGQWVEGAFYIEPYTDCCYIIQWNSSGLGFNEFIKVDGDTICQCTGLKDKNGKLIWENDIMKYQWDRTRIDFIKYQAPIFTYSKTMRWSLQQDEVIGNIFDNQELLEGGE